MPGSAIISTCTEMLSYVSHSLHKVPKESPKLTQRKYDYRNMCAVVKNLLNTLETFDLFNLLSIKSELHKHKAIKL